MAYSLEIALPPKEAVQEHQVSLQAPSRSTSSEAAHSTAVGHPQPLGAVAGGGLAFRNIQWF